MTNPVVKEITTNPNIYLGLSLTDWLMIAAIVISPLIALRVQTFLQDRVEKRERKLRIFKTLMGTRATPLHVDHVAALNMIDLEFSSKIKKEKPVVDAWREYLVHFESIPQKPSTDSAQEVQNNYQANLSAWNLKTTDFLAELLHTMSKALNYDFGKAHLKKGIYHPEGHVNLERDQNLLRISLIRVLNGWQELKMEVTKFPNTEEK